MQSTVSSETCRSGERRSTFGPIGLPDRFSLVFKADGVRIPCHIVWRNEKRIGVAFD